MRRTNQVEASARNDHWHLRSAALAVLVGMIWASVAGAADPGATSTEATRIAPTPSGAITEDATTPAVNRALVISLADRKLELVVDGRVTKVYDIAVGKRSTPSPTGELRIVNKVVRPTYYHRGTVIGPGKSNPLGPRWIGLNRPGYGIHGTNEPRSIGKAASHGCFRMRTADVEELFTLAQVGDKVEVRP